MSSEQNDLSFEMDLRGTCVRTGVDLKDGRG